MTQARTLLEFHDLKVEVETTPGKELLDHMHSTLMGQPGGLRYYHTGLEDRMKSGAENYFMYLRKSGKMLGSVGFCGRHAVTGTLEHDSWLIRYFSIKAPMREVPKKKKDKPASKDEDRRSSVLGRFIQPVFADPAQLREGAGDETRPAIIYALIDQTNLRSMNFSTQMGLETVREIVGFSFSRLMPKKSHRLERIREEEKKRVLDQLADFYQKHTLVNFESVFRNNDYFLIKENGRMVAGVQVYPVRWKIVDFGSPLANRAMKWLTKIAWVRRRISLDHLDFLAFDALYFEEGKQDLLYELLEGILEHKASYIGMLMMDKKTDLHTCFVQQKKLGVVNRFIGSYHADVRVRFIHMPPEIRQEFFDRPAYIPTYDNS